MRNGSIMLLIVIFVALFVSHTSFSTSLWYGDSRPRNISYESVLHAYLAVKINRPIDEGPGQNLIWDPYQKKSPNNLFVGNTINSQTFQTQFVLDIEFILGIAADRVYVTDVSKGTVHFSWESENVIVSFVIMERLDKHSLTLLEAVTELTMKVQDSNSSVFRGTNVTVDIDPLYGVELTNWDASLKLSYAIEVVGGPAVIDDYISLGGLGAYLHYTAHLCSCHFIAKTNAFLIGC